MAETFLTLMADWDDAAQLAFARMHRSLADAGFTGTQTPGLPYHISLATFPMAEEERAIGLTSRLAAAFAPVAVQASHIGIFPGGKVLFAAPDRSPELTALQAACSVAQVGGYPWTPHTTLLIDEKDVIGRAVPVLMEVFQPVKGRITHLHLCAFWPMREVLRVELGLPASSSLR